MNIFSNLSIKYKLTVIIIIISLSLSLSTLTIAAILDINQTKTNVLDNGKLEAKLISSYSQIALSFNDTIWGGHVIEKLNTAPFILNGKIIDSNGSTFVTYQKLNTDENHLTSNKNIAVITENVIENNDTLGKVILTISLDQIQSRKSFYFRMAFIFIITLILSSWVLATYSQSFFSIPISNLAKVADNVSRSEDYSIRVEYNSKDEIGTLYKHFNNMLEQIYIGRKELEKNSSFLNNIIDSMPSILIGIDKTGNITRINNKAEELVKIRREEAMGTNVSKLFPLYSSLLNEIKETISNKQIIEKNGIRNFKTGQIVDMTAYPLVANGIQGAVIRIDDVTDKVRLEEMMVQTEKMMSVGGLAAGMAHEINNPLGIIAQSAQNILQKTNPEIKANIKAADLAGIKMEQLQQFFDARHIPEFVSDIREATSRAASIVSNMLKFSRKSTSDKKEVNIVDVIENTIKLVSTDYDLKKKYDFKNIKIIRDYKDNIPGIFICETEIEQVLLNLFKNGAQAMYEQKDVKVEELKFIIRVYYDTDNLTIEIEDNGSGMTEDVRKRVFEPFYTTKPQGVGTGLGLSVSFMIITNYHKGTFNVESTPGKGTNFIITLPF